MTGALAPVDPQGWAREPLEKDNSSLTLQVVRRGQTLGISRPLLPRTSLQMWAQVAGLYSGLGWGGWLVPGQSPGMST